MNHFLFAAVSQEVQVVCPHVAPQLPQGEVPLPPYPHDQYRIPWGVAFPRPTVDIAASLHTVAME
jgi:hypothetical protein